MQVSAQELFEKFIEDIKANGIHQKAFKKRYANLQINIKQISKISISEIIKNREKILQKMSNSQEINLKVQEQWSQIEKKMYYWMFFCYLELNKKQYAQMTSEDYEFLSKILTQKSTRLMKFQTLHIFKIPRGPKWSQQQDAILLQILHKDRKFEAQKQWILVSKQLFMRGNQQTLKLGRHCRQRWLCHLNPALNKQWKIEQDINLMQFIKRQGKKWSRLVKQFQNSKNQHMIKNRFYSLLGKSKKKYGINIQIPQQKLMDHAIEDLYDIQKYGQAENILIPQQLKLKNEQLNQQYTFTIHCHKKTEDLMYRGNSFEDYNFNLTQNIQNAWVKQDKSYSQNIQNAWIKQDKSFSQVGSQYQITNNSSKSSNIFAYYLKKTESLQSIKTITLKPDRSDLWQSGNYPICLDRSFQHNIGRVDSGLKQSQDVTDPLRISQSAPYSSPFTSEPAPPSPSQSANQMSWLRYQNITNSWGSKYGIYDHSKDNK